MVTLYVILAGEDLERLGAQPDVELPWDINHCSIEDAIALHKVTGGNWSVRGVRDMILQDDVKVSQWDPEGVKALTWLALRKAGVQVRWSELTFNVLLWGIALPKKDPADQPAEPAAEDGVDPPGVPAEGKTPPP